MGRSSGLGMRKPQIVTSLRFRRDEKRTPFQQLLFLEAPLYPLSSRPKRSEVERSLCGCAFLEMFFA